MTDVPAISRRRALSVLGGTGLLAGGLSRPARAAQTKTYDLRPISVADGISMIVGATEYFSTKNGGAIVNCALIETDAGLVIVDTGPSLRYGQALRALARQAPSGRVAAVINTHHHPDHFFGNHAFTDVKIYALDGTIKLARNEGEAFSDNMYRLLGDWMRGTEVVPPNTMLEGATLEIGGRSFAVLSLEGHTGADLALLDKQTGVLIAGDIAFLDRAPTTPHADLMKWREAIDALTAVEAKAIIPGHGPFDQAGASLVQTKAYLTWLERRLRRAAIDGLSMMEIMAMDLPQQYSTMGAMPQEFHRSVAHLYPAIERQAMPLSNR